MRKCPWAPSRAPRRAQGFLDSRVLCCDPLDGFRAGLWAPTILRKVRPTNRSAAQTLSFSTMSTFFGSADRCNGSIRLIDPRAPNCLDILVLRDRIERDCSWVARQVSDISATTSSSAPAICWRRLRSLSPISAVHVEHGQRTLLLCTGVDPLSQKKKAKFWRHLAEGFPQLIDFLCNPKDLGQVCVEWSGASLVAAAVWSLGRPLSCRMHFLLGWMGFTALT